MMALFPTANIAVFWHVVGHIEAYKLDLGIVVNP